MGEGEAEDDGEEASGSGTGKDGERDAGRGTGRGREGVLFMVGGTYVECHMPQLACCSISNINYLQHHADCAY